MALLMLLGGVVVCVVAPVVIGSLVLFYGFPHYLIRLGFVIQRFQVGMKLKYLRNGESVICYGERNSMRDDKPTLVFVHGFTTSWYQWLDVFKYLKIDNHMLALDLPGHGQSTRPSKDDLSTEYMTSILCYFLDSVGLENKKVHLIGTSLGGAVVGIFAAHHPDRVQKVSLICPAMDTPVQTEFNLELKKLTEMNPEDISHNHCTLLPQDVAGLRKMAIISTYFKDKMNFHDQIYQGFLNLRLEKNEFFLDLLKYLNTDENLKLLPSLAPSITMPSQIIWGKYDELVSSSGAEKLKRLLPDCHSVEIFDRCGHSVSIDRPGALCKALMSFINENVKKEE